MALPLYTPTTIERAPDEVRNRTLQELEDALRGADARATPAELLPLDDDEFTAIDEVGGVRHPGLLVQDGGVVLPLRPGDRAPTPDWKDSALCAETDPEAFFPEKGGSTRDAKKVCASCDVRVECLDFALGNDERFGIWGGMSERERRRLKKRVV